MKFDLIYPLKWPFWGPQRSKNVSQHNSEGHSPNDSIYQFWSKSDENCRRSRLFNAMLTYTWRQTTMTTDEVGSVKLTWASLKWAKKWVIEYLSHIIKYAALDFIWINISLMLFYNIFDNLYMQYYMNFWTFMSKYINKFL